MNEQLVYLIAFWSAYFISSEGGSMIRVGMRDRVIELLDALPASFKGVAELRQQAVLLNDNATVAVNHPFNQAMFSFLLEYEKEMPDEFRENIHNIKNFFSAGRQSPTSGKARGLKL